MDRLVKSISVVTPCYNEEQTIERCVLEVAKVIREGFPSVSFEHILIDNASTDRTVEIARGFCQEHHHVRTIVNAQNYGVERSFLHAFVEATGDVVIPILCDLQTPPDLIPQLVEEWSGGADIVIAQRVGASTKSLLSPLRRVFYWLMDRTSRVDLPRGFMGFGLYDQSVVVALRGHEDNNPFFRGLVAEMGLKRSIVRYQENPRLAGTSKHRFASLFETATNALVTYSTFPLYMVLTLGTFFALVGLSAAVVYFILKVMNWSTFSAGIAPTLIVVLIFGSVQLISIGIVGLYADSILRNVRPRVPLREKERINWKPQS